MRTGAYTGRGGVEVVPSPFRDFRAKVKMCWVKIELAFKFRFPLNPLKARVQNSPGGGKR